MAGGGRMGEAMAAPQDLAANFYTGGTTGRSKGVMLSHRNITANAFKVLAEGVVPETAVYLHAAPMFHLANGSAMYSLFLSGGTSAVSKPVPPPAAFDALQHRKVTAHTPCPTAVH